MMNQNNQQPQIFVLHFAGGNKYSLNFVSENLSKSFDVHCLELPGRGRRIPEDLIFNFDDAVQDYTNQIKKLRNGLPYVIYGHSMGASLGLYVCNKLEQEGDRAMTLMVSGNAGPGSGKEDRELRYLMNNEDFKTELVKLGGIPTEVFDTPELFDFFVPIMRADFEVIEKNSDQREMVKIKSPIIALMGTEEETSNEIDNWKNFSSSFFQKKLFEGNHFFINNFQNEICDLLSQRFMQMCI
jgi:surfactin synthase thioesterase subunit